MPSSAASVVPNIRIRALGVEGLWVADDVLAPDFQQTLLAFLKGPGWSHGAYSDSAPDAPRYWYKHFAGVVRDGGEAVNPIDIERRLETAAPLVAQVWRGLKRGPMLGHGLTRCYANGYPYGTEGGLHADSNIPSHYTAIYYPHLGWRPNWAGETVFFNAAGDEIIASVYPRPNRLVIFPGTIPHVARSVSRVCPDMRITLMFKTAKLSF